MKLFFVLLLAELFCLCSVLLAEAENQDLQQVYLDLESVLQKHVEHYAYYLRRVLKSLLA